jgi:Kef-type K+ transport system membrane component KefB
VDTAHIMLAAAVTLGVVGLALLAAGRMHVGSIVALLVAGFVLGPHSPLPLFPRSTGEFQAVGEVGVILLLFAVAIDVRPAQLWTNRRLIVGLGAAQYLVTTAALMALLVLATPLKWNSALLAALGLAMSSSAVAFPYLGRWGAMDGPLGQRVLAVDVFQSFMVAPVLMLVPILAGHAASVASSGPGPVVRLVLAIAVVVLLARVIVPVQLKWAARSMGSGVFTMLIMAAALLASWVMDWAGASAAAGAFVMGLLLSTSVFAPQIKAVVAPARQLLLALFFLSIGMAIDPATIAGEWKLLLAMLPAIFVVKVAVVYAALRAARKVTHQDAFMVAVLLMPLDEIAFVIFAGARDTGLIDAAGYTISLSVLSLSFLIGPLAIEAARRITSSSGPAPSPAATPPNARVIQVGYGPVGRAVCDMLQRTGVDYACIDDNLDNLAQARVRGHRVSYGHLADPSSLWSAGIDHAGVVIVAADPFTYARSVLLLVKQFRPDAHVMAAVPFLAQRDELRRLGITESFALVPDGTVTFGARILHALKVDAGRVDEIVESLRDDDYAQWRESPR